MVPLMLLRKLMLTMAMLLASLAAGAAEVSRADAKAARAVVQAQLAALAADDAVRAFSFAAPPIRDQFGTAERFVEMVRKSYPVVHRPASTTFLTPDGDGADLVVQPVQMTDAAGAAWLAIYRLQRQPDKRWKIIGCEIVRNDGRAT